MGAAQSSGKDNDELVDNLIDNNYIRYRSVEFAFRIVDRGDYFPADKRENAAYKDQAWKSDEGDPGLIHLSAPCIYANALEYLDLQPGQAFLNVGSGTGYFNSLAGYLLTETGINHGVEIYENLIEYAEKTLQQTVIKKAATSAFSFCVPEYFNGSAFYIKNGILYDRIYLGALVPKDRRLFFCNMLKSNGILVMPYGSRLIQIIRRDVTRFTVYQISNVSFSQLIIPSYDNPRTLKVCELPKLTVRPLLELCRTAVRSHIRRNLFNKKPVQMQFEVGVIKDRDVQESEEQRMERIGTLYFMGRRNENENARQNEAVVNQQNEDPTVQQGRHHAEEDENLNHFMRGSPSPVEQNPNNQNNQDNREIEAWTPSEFNEREADEAMQADNENLEREQVVQQDVPMEDGIDAEAAILNQEQEQEGHDNREEHQNNREEQANQRGGMQRFAVHLNPNQNAAAILQNRRHRLQLNLVNGNRLIGFLNADEDEEEDDQPRRDADGRHSPIDPLGLAPCDKTNSAVFHTTEMRPQLDNINMTQIIPNYIEPTPIFKPNTRSGSDNNSIQRSDASTLTDNIRNRPPHFAVRLRATPITAGNNQGPVRQTVLNRIRQAIVRPQQPSTSTSNQDANSTTTQTENQPDQQRQQAPNQHYEDAHQLLQGIQQSIELLQNRQQRVRQLYDRMQRFNANLVPTGSNTQTTAATADSSSTPTRSSPSTSRSCLKRKIGDAGEDASTLNVESSIQEKLSISSDNESSASTKPKLSRSSSMPDFLQEQQFRTVTSNLLGIPQQQNAPSQSSSLLPDSPLLLSSAGDPSSPASSITTTISSISSSAHTSEASISGRSDALSDGTSADLSSIAGGSTASSAQTVSTLDTTSGFGTETDEQQGEKDAENEKRQKLRAERGRQSKKSIDEFHCEFQRRLRTLPLSDRLIRFICYED